MKIDREINYVKNIKVSGIVNTTITITFEKQDTPSSVYLQSSTMRYNLVEVNQETNTVTFVVSELESNFSIHTKDGTLIDTVEISNIKLKKLAKRIYVNLRLIKKGIVHMWVQHKFIITPTLIKKYWGDYKNRRYNMEHLYYDYNNQEEYLQWLSKKETLVNKETFVYQPKISILIPAGDTVENIQQTLDSIENQIYSNYEVWILTTQENQKLLSSYNTLVDDNIDNLRNQSTGEYITFVEVGDILHQEALYQFVKALNKNKWDMVYCDEDQIDNEKKRSHPIFKPDFSPHTQQSYNYIGKMVLFNREILMDVLPKNTKYKSLYEYDYIQRIVEYTSNIGHVSMILYHRSQPALQDNLEQMQIVKESFERQGVNASVNQSMFLGYNTIDIHVDNEPSVCIVIPTRDYSDVTRLCLESLYKNTKYTNFQVIIANNDSVEPQTYELFAEYKSKYDNFNVIDCNYKFNYSKLNNDVVCQSDSDVIVLLNNDTEIITPNWLKDLATYAMLPNVGAVGARLLFPDNSLQHAGIIGGLGKAVAAHHYIAASMQDLGAYNCLYVTTNYCGVTAACLAIERKKYNQVGGLEEALEVAYNDVDLNFKLLDKGYYNVYLPQVQLYHHESKSRGLDITSAKYKKFLQESSYMYKKWPKYIHEDPYYNIQFSREKNFKLDK